VPIAYSAGFHPHPRLSYWGAAPTGAASEAEYLEMRLSERRELEELRVCLDAALPEGIAVCAAADGTGGLGAAMPSLLAASLWRLTWADVDRADLDRAVGEFLDAGSVLVTRPARGPKGRPRELDVRPAVVAIAPPRRAAAGEQVLKEGRVGEAMDVIVRHGQSAVRPDDVALALERFLADSPSAPAAMIRLAQGPLRPGPTVGDPFEA
jgi:radical SAM-linked protein